MADTRWVKIKSWHAVASSFNGDNIKTRCGRWVGDPLAFAVDVLPAGKSCENCLRIIAREGDR